MPLYERNDWVLFRSLDTLGQRAGVSRGDLPAVVAKELVDNALDACGSCRIDPAPPNGFIVEDDGEGLPGNTPSNIALLFSISRPLSSSKLKRLPTRGALGNGLRVVAGAVLASGGSLQVTTRGQVLRLVPQDDGMTHAVLLGQDDRPGTRIEVQLGASLPLGDDALAWALNAHLMAEGGERYKGKTSAHWYDEDSFFELMQAAGTRPAREVIAEFDGCSGQKAGQVAADVLARAASSLTRPETAILLARARGASSPVKPDRLGRIGQNDYIPGDGYAVATGVYMPPLTRGHQQATIPYLVEAWAALRIDAGGGREAKRIGRLIAVNKTPIMGRPICFYDPQGRDLNITGCGPVISVPIVGLPPTFVAVNVMTPHIPLVNDGKTPDLSPLAPTIVEAIRKALAQAKRARPTGGGTRSIKEIVHTHLPQAVAIASSDGRFRFSQRQLFYAIRPLVAPEIGKDPEYETFTKALTTYEEIQGRLQGLYRDPRGIVCHPHTGEEIPLGTIAVEDYERPVWTFNKVLYCEKEGFFSILRSARWPETHDCALLTSKGHATRATKDLIDHLGDTEEDVTFYCIHDADAAGTMIHQALQGATGTRAARRVRIVNLGLDPWEAVEMGLPVEDPSYEKHQPVARYVEEFDAACGTDWSGWLQTHRVELNAMTTERFVAWLNDKMTKHAGGKVIPPPAILMERLQHNTRTALTTRITERILTEADLAGQVADAERALSDNLVDVAMALPGTVTKALQARPSAAWGVPVKERAIALCALLDKDEE